MKKMKTELLGIRLSEADKNLIQDKATENRLSLSAYARMKLINTLENEI